MSRAYSCIAFALAASACVPAYRIDAPAPPPARVPIPALEQRAVSTAAPPGKTHVVLDAEKESKVIEVLRLGEIGRRGRRGTNDQTAVVCEKTPCIADLAPGDHDLRFYGPPSGKFQPVAVVDATVGKVPTEFRATLGAREREKSGEYTAGQVLSVIGFLVGAAGFITWGTTDSLEQGDSNPWAVPSIIVGCVGAAMLIAGTVMELDGRGLFRPGNHAQWNLAGQ